MSVLHLVFLITAVITLTYFAVLNGIYAMFTVIAAKSLRTHLRRRSYSALDEALDSPFTPGISVLLPAFNESAGIVQSIRSLLALRYPRVEIIVVNDGSTDDTLERLTEAFDLVPVHRALRTGLKTQEV
ncbi:MAG TPA: glycosyltransferase family 2 protein, partial [Candidatus Elarobacter sp.]|nr:glycosyltransferase family 2 protein [Candidatus Elarobacter sp.]